MRFFRNIKHFFMISGLIMLSVQCTDTKAVQPEKSQFKLAYTLPFIPEKASLQTNELDTQLANLKKSGVESVEIKVLWGLVEGQNQGQYNWENYDLLFAKIQNASLKITPVFCFYATEQSPIPSWLIKSHSQDRLYGHRITSEDFLYQDENQKDTSSDLSVWADPLFMQEYLAFLSNFKQHFQSYSNSIDTIFFSFGSNGELTYPQSEIALQSYSWLAAYDYQMKIVDKYTSLKRINSSWNVNYKSIDSIQPLKSNEIFNSTGLINDQKTKDFINWYHDSLFEYTRIRLETLITNFSDFSNHLNYGIKIPMMTSENPENIKTSRVKELEAGLIGSDYATKQNGYGYQDVIQFVKQLSDKTKQRITIVLHNSEKSVGSEADNNSVIETWLIEQAEKNSIKINKETTQTLSNSQTSIKGSNLTKYQTISS